METRSRILISVGVPAMAALSKSEAYSGHVRSRAPGGFEAIMLISIMRLFISIAAPSTSRMKSVLRAARSNAKRSHTQPAEDVHLPGARPQWASVAVRT